MSNHGINLYLPCTGLTNLIWFRNFSINLKSNLFCWFFSIVFINFLYVWINQKTYNLIVRTKSQYVLLMIISSTTSYFFFKIYNWTYLFNQVSILCLLINFFLIFAYYCLRFIIRIEFNDIKRSFNAVKIFQEYTFIFCI